MKPSLNFKTPPHPICTCLRRVLLGKWTAGGLQLQLRQPVGKAGLYKLLLTYPCLPVPLSKASMVIGTGGGRTQLLYILPRMPKYHLGEVDWVVQLRSL